MKKFEYKIEKLLMIIPGIRLEDLGQEGWELVTIVKKLEDKPEPNTEKYLHYFKREIT